MKKLLKPYREKGLDLKNHMVMAPMTRNRAIGNIPNDLMSEYYGQRSGAGLIITEGTSPAPEGLGYPRIPGIFNDAQIEGWKKTTDTVHKGNGKIFLQIMHTGRIGNILNLPKGKQVLGVSNIKADGQLYTDGAGMQDFTEPIALTTKGVGNLITEYINASKNAIKAGFDGIELHAANGYFLEQFLNPNVNNRTDEFGGSIANRCKAIVEIVRETAKAIGKQKVGIRFSPCSTFNDMAPYKPEDVNETYALLAKEMNEIDIAYIHISANPNAPQKTYDAIRHGFSNTIILCNGLTPETAEEVLSQGFADLVGFARNFLANPDLVERIEKNAPLNTPDMNTFYKPGAEGYTDYPTIG